MALDAEAPDGSTSPSSRTDIVVSGVTQRFSAPRSFTALADVSIEVGSSEFVSIVGPSGCGKSTLHPLPHRRPRQHRVHQMGGTLGHPPATTARTPSAPFTRKRHQVLVGAALASKLRHAVLEHTARQELPELPFHELRQARAVAGLRDRAQEDLQVLGDDLVEHGVRGITRPVDRSLEAHGPEVGSRRRLGQS